MRLLSVLIAVAVVAGCSRPEALPEPVRAVRTITVAPGSASGLQEFAGEVRARTESRLAFRVSGLLVERRADLGAVVRPGQVLARLDPQDLRLGQQAAQAAVTAAQANAEQADADLARFRELRRQGFISDAELERRTTSATAARAQLEQARAQAAVQGRQTDYAALLAPVSGVVTAVEAEPGAVVGAGTPIVRVAHDGPRDVVFSVPEDRVAEVRALAVRPGAFQVRPWGSDRLMPARVREVAASADPTTRTFLVKLEVGSQPAGTGLQLGQTATVVVTPPQAEGVVKLPLTALREHAGATSVWVVDPSAMTVSLRPVRVAGADGNEAVVADGIAPGTLVVTAGVHVLTPGQKVRLYAEAAPPAAPSASMAVGR
jgi:multidrug efflux system membrane fusion protein